MQKCRRLKFKVSVGCVVKWMRQWDTVCECPMLAQRDYIRGHDLVCRKIHWEVCRKIGFDVYEKWYKHKPEKVVENNSWRIIWDDTIQTDVIEARPNKTKIRLDVPVMAELKRGRNIRWKVIITIWKENWRKYGICLCK